MAIPCSKHFQNIVSGSVLHSLGLLCRADDYDSNLDSSALRAMTDPEGESAIMLLVVFLQLWKLGDAIHNFDCCPKALPFGSFIPSLQPVDRAGMVIVEN